MVRFLLTTCASRSIASRSSAVSVRVDIPRDLISSSTVVNFCLRVLGFLNLQRESHVGRLSIFVENPTVSRHRLNVRPLAEWCRREVSAVLYSQLVGFRFSLLVAVCADRRVRQTFPPASRHTTWQIVSKVWFFPRIEWPSYRTAANLMSK